MAESIATTSGSSSGSSSQHSHGGSSAAGHAPGGDAAAAQRIDQVLDQTQHLMRNIERLTRAADTGGAGDDASAPTTGEPRTIAELDHALAANVDALLEAQRDSIEAVLDDVFQEQAAIVQKLGEAPTARAETVEAAEASAPAAADPADAVGTGDAAAGNAAEAAASKNAQAAHMPHNARQAVTPPGDPTVANAARPAPPSPAHAVAAPAASEAAHVDTADVAAEGAVAGVAVIGGVAASVETASSETSTAPEPGARAPAAGATQAFRALESPVHRPSEPVREVERRAKPSENDSRPGIIARLVGGLMRVAARPVIGALVLVNLPLRLVPVGMKPMVDWIALSLVAWVPIIWIMILTLGAGDHAGHEDGHDAGHGGGHIADGAHDVHDAHESQDSHDAHDAGSSHALGDEHVRAAAREDKHEHGAKQGAAGSAPEQAPAHRESVLQEHAAGAEH